MNTNTSRISYTLLAAPYQLNIWFGSFLWIAGNISSIGNMMVFCSRSFRNRAYSIYLLSKSMTDFVYFNFVLLTRILEKGFGIPINNRYDIMCKFRQFVSLWCNQVSFTLFAFATVDRLLSTQRSNKYRRWSNRISLAYKLSITCLFIWFLLIGHRLILYSIRNGICVGLPGVYADYDIYFEVIFAGMCPPIVMFVLAYLLIRNVRNVIQRRIVPKNNISFITITNRPTLQQLDSQLTLMLILQSIITIITYVPHAVELTYTNLSKNWSKSCLQMAEEQVFIDFVHLLSYIFFVSSFYISIISNSGFRRHIKESFRRKKTNNSTRTTHAIIRTDAAVIIQRK
ncbi:unnamed protein product [Rotaria sp. Silwood2]|nr:unnamed protein product [Rotaria sp. Silwood2]CAF2673420.1 unnamed protein product [Rotaria sp. Silwood2]CAF3080291.1 unnamed protein product [Rotaria sp. Silwood2]CAF4268488.1 unnamed protein product [Rotaria sp. Silwood2]CAF4322135.1 unnamed protein product [Rotaria sp. Silwood2]